jgi:hypothetical protein
MDDFEIAMGILRLRRECGTGLIHLQGATSRIDYGVMIVPIRGIRGVN